MQAVYECAQDAVKTIDELTLLHDKNEEAVKRLMGAGILVQTDDANRNRTFAYEAYLEVLKDGT